MNLFHLLVHTEYRGGNCVGFVPIRVEKYCEPAIVAHVKATELSGDTLAHLNTLTGP